MEVRGLSWLDGLLSQVVNARVQSSHGVGPPGTTERGEGNMLEESTFGA